MRIPFRSAPLNFSAGILLLFVVAFVALLLHASTALAHNVVASGSYDCDGDWAYSASYVNGGGGGSSDNRLVVVDVNIGGTVIRQYQYFDTIKASDHPAPPAGFTVVDHTTKTTFQLFALSGQTSPITVSGTIKIYSAGTSLSPSTDPAYPHYLADFSQDPIPDLDPAHNCSTATASSTSVPPTSTATSTATNTATPTLTSTATTTPTSTSTSTSTPTATPTGPVFGGLALSVDKPQAPAGLDNVPIGDIPISVVDASGAPDSSKVANVSFKSSALSSIALSSIALSSIGTQSSALSSIALSSIPISTPGGWDAVLAGTSLQGVPTQSVTLGELLALNPAPAALSSIKLSDIDLSASALQSLRFVSVALGSTALSSIPIPGGAGDWCQALANVNFSCASIGKDANSIGSVTLLQLDADGAPVNSLALSSIALSSINLSSSALSSIALSSIALSSIDLSGITLGDVALSSIDVQGAALSSIALSSIAPPSGQATWCDEFATEGHTCASLGISDSSTLFDVVTALQSAGIPLQSTALSSIALSSIALSSIAPDSLALSSIALSSIAVNGTALSSIALSSIATQSTALSSIALSSIPLSATLPNASALSSIALSSIANVSTVIDCTKIDCATATLGEAADAGAILPGATLGQIAGALGTFTLGDLQFYGTATVQDILTALNATPAQMTFFLSFLYGDNTIGGVQQNLGNVTLGDLLIALLTRSDYPWENTSLAALANADLPPADNASVLAYTAQFQYLGGSSATTMQVAVTLPDGFHYLKGSSQLVLTALPGSGNPSFILMSAPGDPVQSGDTITWTIPRLRTEPFAAELTFNVRPGLVLGPGFTSSLSVNDDGHQPASISGQAPVRVTENFEPDNNPATAPIIGPDELIISHISSAGDQDFYRIPAGLPAGTRVQVLLSHQAQDNDVALFRPTSSQLRAPSGAALSSIPLEDAPPAIGAATPPPQVLQDINIPQSLALSSISTNRGNADDGVSALSLDDSGFFTVEVAGYNGDASGQPYVLREKLTPPPIAPQCPPRAFPFAGQGVAGVAPGSVSANTNTLFLVDEKRLGDLYGATKAADVVSALNTLAGRNDLGVAGAVIPVEGNSAVAAAYDAWDANPCSPTGANGVVSAINTMVDGYRATATGIENVVIVGDDDVVPFARIPDLTNVSNESDYTGDVLAVNSEDALLGSVITSNVLSDNPYGAFHPVPWLDHQLYVPNVAVGRLVETPDQIIGQLTQFQQFNGELDPKSALTTGYDFLSDGAAKVADSLDGIVGAANDTRLINGTWTSADLATHFNDATPVPGIASINAHYDHHRLLPGAGNTTGDESDLYTTQNIVRSPVSPQILPGEVLFSMGCHAGLNVSDAFAGTPSAGQAPLLLDWPQAFADQGAAVYVGNTGYGYGDTDTVAYSEQLMANFAARLGGSASIGQALTFAKQDYYGSLAQYQTYDEKVLSETAFYGLPMYRIGAPPAPVSATGAASSHALTASATPTPLPFTTDAITGLPAVNLGLTPTFTKVDLGADGAYYTIDGNSEATSGRPILPLTSIDLPPGTSGEVAHGIIVTAMTSSDQPNFQQAFSQPVVDQSIPVDPAAAPFPATLHNLTTFFTPDGQQQRAVFTPAQFIPDPSATPGTGTERLFNTITGEALYSNSSDFTPPTILETHATGVGGVISFAVNAQDDLPDNVVRVFVLYRPDASSNWRDLELVHTPGTTRWTSSAVASGDLSFFVYAVDGAGNVATSSNKGSLFQVTTLGVPSGLTISVSGPQASGGWYTSAQISVSGASGATFETSVDGAPFQPYTAPFDLTGDGIHFVQARGSDASTGEISVPVDTSGPAITLTSPADAATFKLHQVVNAAYFCTDAGSGVQSCAGPAADGAAIDTSTPGAHAFAVTSQDIAGFPSTVTHNYTVSTCDIGDTDCDGMPDVYELAHPCLNAQVADGSVDADSDGLTNLQEYTLGTNPCNADTDGDGVNDGTEVNVLGTNPLKPDTDGDGCGDGKEGLLTPPTNPLDPWDFYSVPVPALFSIPNPLGVVKDSVITGADAQSVFAYFRAGATLGTTLYEQDLNGNGIKDGIEYDRSAVGSAHSGPPDGIITAADAQLAFAQFKLGYHC